jgi:hypothetical protein
MSLPDSFHHYFKKFKKLLIAFIDSKVDDNRHYRPTGEYSCKSYFQTINDPEFKYVEVYQNQLSKVEVPDVMVKQLSPYYLNDEFDLKDKKCLKIRSTYFVATIPYGRLYTNNEDTIAYITSDNILLSDISLQWRFYQPKPISPTNGIFEKLLIPFPIKIKGTVCSLLAGAPTKNNYSHWFLDAFSRIHLLKKAGVFDEIDYFVVGCCNNDFQKESLKLIGIPEEKIVQAGPDFHIHAEKLIVTSHPRGKNSHITPDWVVDFYKDQFTSALTITDKYPPLVYINRKDASHRKIENEEELEKMLEKLGFKSYSASTLSFTEKIKLFNSAEIVLSITGAGLQNLAFCRKGTKVIELFPGNLVHTIFCDLAQKAGLEYYPIIYQSGKTPKTHLECVKENIIVDVNSLEKLLTNLIPQNQWKYV